MISPKGVVFIAPQIIKFDYRMGVLHLTMSLKIMVCKKMKVLNFSLLLKIIVCKNMRTLHFPISLMILVFKILRVLLCKNTTKACADDKGWSSLEI
jgi:hypothetical protein